MCFDNPHLSANSHWRTLLSSSCHNCNFLLKCVLFAEILRYVQSFISKDSTQSDLILVYGLDSKLNLSTHRLLRGKHSSNPKMVEDKLCLVLCWCNLLLCGPLARYWSSERMFHLLSSWFCTVVIRRWHPALLITTCYRKTICTILRHREPFHLSTILDSRIIVSWMLWCANYWNPKSRA